MIFKILVTLFLCILFFMLYSSRHAYFLRIPVLLGILVGAVCVWHTEAAATAAVFLGVGRASDLVFYCCILLAFYCFFTLYLKHEKTKEDLTILTREIALNQAQPPDKENRG